MMPLSKFWNRDTFYELAMPALTTMFGLQLLRVLLPSFVWYLGDSLGVPYATLGPIAIAIFLAAFLAEPFRRSIGSRRAFMIAVGGTGLTRLIIQLFADPTIAFAGSAVGVILFTFYFPLALARARSRGTSATRKLGRGFLLGIAIDTAIYGALGTLDVAWQSGLASVVLVALLASAQWWLLARDPFMPDEIADAPLGRSMPLAAVGPFVFLMGVIFQNVARATTLTGFPPPLAFGLIVLTNAIGLAAALFPLLRERSTSFAIFLGVVFLAILASRPDPARSTADFLYFFGNLLLFPFVTLIFGGMNTSKMPHQNMWRTSIANGIGWLLFVVLAFLYYVSYDIRLPFSSSNLPFFAMLLVGAAVLAAIRRMPNLDASSSWTSATAAFALVLFPILTAVNFQSPATKPGNGFPIRVMSYNLHNGFNTDGRLDPDSLVRTIQAANPDIVGLQEVERGWMIDSNLDLLTYISHKLQMPYLFAPTADPIWGNAILTRYPIKESGLAPLPPRTLLLKRGLMWARVDVGNGEDLLVIATHFHQIDQDTEIRQQQSPAIINFWNQRPRTIFLGDLNAQPNSIEVGMLRDSGLEDSFSSAGVGDGLTFSSAKPYERIDYIWFSPDLAVKDFIIPKSTASDHYGIAVTVGTR